MKTSKRTVVVWVEDDRRVPEYVTVHSKMPTDSELSVAGSRALKGECVQYWTQIVFLDSELDTPGLRSYLESESLRRYELVGRRPDYQPT